MFIACRLPDLAICLFEEKLENHHDNVQIYFRYYYNARTIFDMCKGKKSIL